MTRVASNGWVRTGFGSNRSGSTCSQTMASPLLLRTTASRGTIRPVIGRAARGHHGDRLADAEPGGRVRDDELHDRGVLLQRAAEPLIGQRHRLSAGRDRGRLAERSRIDLAIGQRLDPKRPSDRRSGTGHPAAARPGPARPWPTAMTPSVGARRSSGSVRALRIASRRRAQAFKFALGIDDLAFAARRRVRRAGAAVASCLGDRDQLLDLADLFGDRRAVGERQIRIDLDQNVALADRLTDARDRRLRAEPRVRRGCSARRWCGSDRR